MTTDSRAVPRWLAACSPRSGAARAAAASDAAKPAASRPIRPRRKVALLQAPKRPGEVIVRGDLSPASHGPYAFDGRYVVRFEQFAPEDPNLDFTAQTAFVATPRPPRRGGRPGQRDALPRRAAARAAGR